MWKRFTAEARQVVFNASQSAVRFGHDHVSPEHLLLGLLEVRESMAVRTIEALGMSPNRVRAQVEKQMPSEGKRPTADMTLTPSAKRVVDIALQEADFLHDAFLETEHLLLGLIREGASLASQVLGNLGLELEAARREILVLRGSSVASSVNSLAPDELSGPASEDLMMLQTKIKEEIRESEVEAGDALKRQYAELSQRVLLLGSRPEERDKIAEFLLAIGLKPIHQAVMPVLKGDAHPPILDVLAAAFRLGPVVALLGSARGPALPETLFDAGLAYGVNPQQTIFIRTGSLGLLQPRSEALVLHLDNSRESREKFIAALRKAGCTIDLTNEKWQTAGDLS